MKSLLCCALLVVGATSAGAVALTPVSYDLNNGHGVASGGSFNYWDLGHSGGGSTNVDNALLSGGLGDLTDGVVTGLNWVDAESIAGTGPYVGWRSSVLGSPSVLFHFATPVAIDSVSIHADDSDGNGGVDLPATVTLAWDTGSVQLAVTDPDPTGAGPSWLSFSQLGIPGTSSLRVQFGYSNEWVFVDEINFAGSVVPEPATLAQFGFGLALLGILAARQRPRR